MRLLRGSGVRRAVGTLARRLPKHMPRESRGHLFQELARTLGVEQVVRVGSNGAIEGSLRDEGLFRHYLRDGEWATESLEILRGFFKTHGAGTFIDVGASIGLTLIPMAAVGGLRCIGIEASPVQFGLLQRNLLRNNAASGVELHNVAVFETAGTISFEISETNHGDNRVRRNSAPVVPGRYGEETRRSVTVRAASIDDLISADSIKRPLAIKMDIQGSEPAFFLGGAALVERTDLLLTEYWPYGMRRLGYDPEQFLRAIQRSFGSGTIIGADARGAERVEIGELVSEMRTRSALTETGHFDVVLHKAGPGSSPGRLHALEQNMA